MLGAALLERFLQLAQQLALVLGQLDGRLDHDVAVQVAGIAGAHALDALAAQAELLAGLGAFGDRKSTRLNSSHLVISYAVFCLKKKRRGNNLTCSALSRTADMT